jgi:hypothetical protein
MRNRRCVYVRGGEATTNWRVKWSVETGESEVDVLSRKASERLRHERASEVVRGVGTEQGGMRQELL